MKPTAPDLTRQPPRSTRVRLGEMVLFPRILDKCRAAVAGTNGEYKFDCPLDQRFFTFTGIKAAEFRKQVARGRTDSEMLAWVGKHSTTKPGPVEIAAWNAWQETRGPLDVESRDYFNGIHKSLAPHREDISSWFDLLDLDDYVSFGGQP